MILRNYIKHPIKQGFLGMARHDLLNWMPDSLYLRIKYYFLMGKKLNLSNPKTYNEKLQWLKLHDRKDEYTIIVDKSTAKEWASTRIGSNHIIKTLGIWDNFEDIDFKTLPKSFVLKCTHDSGGLVICKDKEQFDYNSARDKINSSLKTKYYYVYREWPYKNVKPRIIAEEYIEDTKTSELRDYKFFCFDGVPKALFVATERQVKNEEVKFDFFDMEYNHLNIKQGHPNAKEYPDKPEMFEEMKNMCEVLSKGFPQVRVDLYEANGKIYFGEMTLSHFAGMVPFVPEEWDYTFGSWIKLPKNER